MQLVFRDIAQVVNHKVNLTLPDYIDTEKVEVIVIPYKIPEDTNSKIDYNLFFGVSNIGTELINKRLESLRNEWERTILD